MPDFLPNHLKKYIVTQNYGKYTPVDQACWRYTLRQLRKFLSTNAHECYLEGLEKTGIDVEQIPLISDISAKLEKFGWRALPVSGFIPPAAFMELQALSVLPIASDMRTIDHLKYTPAPDIVHEAAGHAPILVHPEFSAYLQKYAQVARKAIISKEDLDLYDAIRELSDIKESPNSSVDDIQQAEKKLDFVSKNISHISEASQLSRMNWWTAEYGLIGDLEKPKIFGAGLLSSIGESASCLSSNVKKLPLTLECLKQGYDITEHQPQLFVTPDFQTLHKVLEEMAKEMAYQIGGISSFQKIIKAQSVNTAQLDSGIQISGVANEVLTDKSGKVSYLKFSGPCQLSFDDKEILNQGCSYHQNGFSTPVGPILGLNKKLMDLTSEELKNKNWIVGENFSATYESGISVEGRIKSWTRMNGKNIILSLENARATWNDQILFDPSWGTFDIAIGESLPSVFGGPADRLSFGETDDFVAKLVPVVSHSQSQKDLFVLYNSIRDTRVNKISGKALSEKLTNIYFSAKETYKNEWLLFLEIYELASKDKECSALSSDLLNHLNTIVKQKPDLKSSVDDGLLLVGIL